MATAGLPVDSRLRVFYDGSSTPAIDQDLGTLLALHFQATGRMTLEHVHVEQNWTNQENSFLLTFPMPFGSHIKITILNPASFGSNLQIFSQVVYRLEATDRSGGMRLRGQGQRFADGAVARTSTQASTLLNVTGGPGYAVYCGYVAGVNATNFSWIERNFAFYVDGEQTPSLETTGTEDTFDSGWGWYGASDTSLGRHSYIGAYQPASQPNVACVATDWLSKWGGVPFSSSLQITVLTEAAVTTGDSYVYCILYYQ